MAVTAQRVTVATTATRIDQTGADTFSGTSLQVRCATTDLYLGASDVTAATGYLLPAGDSFGVDLDAGEKLYAVVASGTAEAHVLRVSI